VTSLDPSDTIAAIASSPGPGLRGMVRVTGPDALAVVFDAFEGATDRPIKPERRVGRLRVVGIRRPLDVAVSLWPGPRTYTGQPLAEVHASGSEPLLRAILATFLARGARLAEPGEFTLRAFLSGRIDLTQSEAVLGVIDARTPEQLDAALAQLAGGLASPITALRDHLADVLAHLEANLDFAEEPDVDLLKAEALADSLDESAREVERLARQLQGRERPEGCPRVVLVGPPNAGKSRLFNALIEADRAIVSPVAGTTRDYLEAACNLEGLAITLVDTAGLEAAGTTIEAQAQAARGRQASVADLLLECRSADSFDPELLESDPDRPTLHVWTKADVALPPSCVTRYSDGATPPPHPNPPPQGGRGPENRADPLASDSLPPCGGGPGWGGVAPPGLVSTPPPSTIAFHLTSASTGEGLAELGRAIASTLRSSLSESSATTGTAARCGESLTRAAESLARAAETLRLGLGDELVAIDLRQTLEDLGRVVGAVVTDDLLDRIFRRFCIGK
jgi:tRNA modification GTPase